MSEVAEFPKERIARMTPDMMLRLSVGFAQNMDAAVLCFRLPNGRLSVDLSERADPEMLSAVIANLMIRMNELQRKGPPKGPSKA